MPTGKVRFYDEEKGFGFISSDEGQDVFLHATALPAGATVKAGTRLEFGIADGKRGPQALSVRVLEAPASLAKRSRKPADDMAIIIEDLVKLLDGVGGDLRRGRYPSSAHGAKVAAVLRKVADELDGCATKILAAFDDAFAAEDQRNLANTNSGGGTES